MTNVEISISTTTKTETIRSLIRDIPDFPKPGILFRDITPLLAHPHGLRWVTDELCNRINKICHGEPIDAIVAVESRGFIFGAPLADRMQCGLIPVRKQGKLPAAVDRVSYELEYGKNYLEMHTNSLHKGARVLLIDDVLATGGTAAAAAQLVHKQGGHVICAVFVIELLFLSGQKALVPMPVESLIQYDL